jgi:site-specific recombinase XerD
MLEEFFKVPAAAERLRTCGLGAHLDGFCALLVGLGYRRYTIRLKLWLIRDLARWMATRRLTVADLDARRIDDLAKERVRRGHTDRGIRPTAMLLLEHLRSAGLVARPEPTRDNSPSAALLGRYELFLRQERGLAEVTISAYLKIARNFIADRLAGRAIRPDSLGPDDVHEFMLAGVRRMIPKRAQFMGTALRSFLRSMFLAGETRTDLAFAVPIVRQWRLSSVPRHLATRDVERILRACDRSSATGRRDYAILLLLARLGLRAGEVVSLELGDLHWRAGEIVVRGKGRVHDRLPLLPDVGAALALYLQKDRPRGGCRRVFLCGRAPRRGFNHTSTVSTIVERALARAGLSPAMRGAHLLRHSLATTMVRRGASFSEIGQVLRHRSPNTTEVYAKLDWESLRSVAGAWPTAARGER